MLVRNDCFKTNLCKNQHFFQNVFLCCISPWSWLLFKEIMRRCSALWRSLLLPPRPGPSQGKWCTMRWTKNAQVNYELGMWGQSTVGTNVFFGWEMGHASEKFCLATLELASWLRIGYRIICLSRLSHVNDFRTLLNGQERGEVPQLLFQQWMIWNDVIFDRHIIFLLRT